ncbi:hypothetical protein CAEBREN_31857, partial [Caenorhabditis brenneri]
MFPQLLLILVFVAQASAACGPAPTVPKP